MQVMVWDVEDNAGRERFIVIPSKSHALKYLSNKRKENDEDIFVYNKKIKDSKSATHLGLVRNVNGKPDIKEKINLGRKTAYSLMGQVSMGEGGGSNHLRTGIYGQLLWYLDCCMGWSQYCLVRKM